MAIEEPTAPSCYYTYDVPVAIDQSMESLYTEEALRHNAQDSLRSIVGPMPVTEFLRRFLKVDGLGDIKHVPGDKMFLPEHIAPPRLGSAAQKIYEPLLEYMNGNNLCPGFVFRHASGPPSPARKLGRTKPHICCYPEEHISKVDGSSATSEPELGHAELFIDVTSVHPNMDYFQDPPSTQPRSSCEFTTHVASRDGEVQDAMDMAWGQHISYVTEVFARQYRVFFFTVALVGHFARLFRWDRAGCIVTERFDIRTRPDLLCDFLRRFSKTSNIGRGHDATVGAATREEEATFQDIITHQVKAQLGVEGAELEKAVAEHYLPGRVIAMHVLQQGAVAGPKTVRRYLVSRPVISPLFLDGRGTRGFWAVDSSTHQVAFLKDTWRFTGYPLEGDALEDMNAKGVRSIPSLLCHGDVPDVLPVDHRRRFEFKEFQSTQTDEYCHDSFACLVKGEAVSVAKLAHYRVVLGTVGYPLKHLRGTEELLHATFDVLQGMADARNKDSRIHRDLSMGNILLVTEEGRSARRGYLIDWDASCEVDDTGASIHRDRPGTWEYMSLAMVHRDRTETEHRQTLEDDMESLLYVIIHCGLLWLPHDLTDAELDATIAMFFTSRNVSLSDTAAIRREAKERGIRPIEIGCGLKDWLFGLLDHFAGFELSDGEGEDEGEDVQQPAGAAGDGAPSGEPQQEWNIENLEKFWEEFLRTHTLDKADRVVHNHPRATGIGSAAGEGEPPKTDAGAEGPSDATPFTSSVAKGKRRAEEPDSTDDPDTPDRKRARLQDASSSSASPILMESSGWAPGKLVEPRFVSLGDGHLDNSCFGTPGRTVCMPMRAESSASNAVLGKRAAEERDLPQPVSPAGSGPPSEREQKRLRLDSSTAAEVE